MSTKTPSVASEVFDKTLTQVINLLLLGKAHLEIGREIGKQTSADPAVEHVAPTFWGLSIVAHLDAAQLFAFKLFDTQDRAVTIPFLLDQMEQQPELFPLATEEQIQATVQTACNQIAGMKEPLERINAKRNRVIAHLDRTIVLDPATIASEGTRCNRCAQTAGSRLSATRTPRHSS